MRILHIAHYNFSAHNNKLIFKENINNGIEKFLSSFIKYDKDIEHYIYIRDIFYENTFNIIGYKNNELIYYNTYEGIDIDKEYGFEEINKIILELKVNLIHIHYLVEGTKSLCHFIKKTNKDINVISTIHDDSYIKNIQESNNKKNTTKIFLQDLDLIIFPHEIIYNNFLNLFPLIEKKSIIIPNGVKENKYKISPRKDKKFNIAILGRLNFEKGLGVVDKLISLNKNKNINFIVFGEIIDITENKKINQIKYDISDNNLLELFIENNIDLVCIPSIIDESFSYTSMEATSLGVPILTFDLGAFKNIEKEKRGFIVSEVTAEKMLEKINELYKIKINNNSEWKKIFNSVNNYNIPLEKDMIESYKKQYKKYLKQENYKDFNYKEILKNFYYKYHKSNFLVRDLNEQINIKENEKNILQDKIRKLNENEKNLLIKLDENTDKYKHKILLLEEMIQRSQNQIIEYERIIKYKEKHWVRNIVGTFIKKIKRLINRFRNTSESYNSHEDYQRWLFNERKKYSQIKIDKQLKRLKNKPKISFLVPVYNAPVKLLKDCLDSIKNQYYKNFEVCIADDCSTNKDIKIFLEEYCKEDRRFKVKFRAENGHIAKCTNTALDMATGEYISLVDNDDFIEKNALFEFIKLINENPNVDMAYSDEDKVTEDGKTFLHPFFKPKWSPETFFAHMYTCHLGFYRTSIAKEIGGFDPNYNGSQDYDFVLRFTEKTNNIYHIEKILYHWRLVKTSTATGGEIKNYAYDASLKCKQACLDRRGIKGKVVPLPEYWSSYNYYYPEQTDFVSIIIPIKDKVKYLKNLIRSIYKLSTWKNFEIIIINNNSVEKNTLKYLKQIKKKYKNIKILDISIKFNYSKLNNEAVKIAKGNLLLFLNNDIEVITRDWLERMIGQAKLKGVGAVGARLYYSNNTIQHAGVAIIKDGPIHLYCGTRKDDIRDFARMQLNYNYIAVTGAVLMVEKKKFLECGQFDEKLAIAYNDVDLCINLHSRGYLSVCRMDVELYHYESVSRGLDFECKTKMKRLQKERKYLNSKWPEVTKKDPFYNELSRMQC